MTNKRYGRVGDVPIFGAGTYANNKTAAISCTGWGEKLIKNNVSHDVSAIMEYKGLGVEAAAREVVEGKLDPGDGGLIAVSHSGEIALVFNSDGMFRGAADSAGRFEVAIWE
jgi:beta-aspartyl-peptidase (threonine type)